MSANYDRYLAAAQAMQAGVAIEHADGSNDGSPKHLRVGVNSALVCCAAIGRLLIDKGLITFEEYEAAQADEMEAEQARHEQRLGVRLA